jgi:hypothetical protein
MIRHKKNKNKNLQRNVANNIHDAVASFLIQQKDVLLFCVLPENIHVCLCFLNDLRDMFHRGLHTKSVVKKISGSLPFNAIAIKKTRPTCHRGDEWSEDIRLSKVVGLARLHSELRRSYDKDREPKRPDVNVETQFKSGRLRREERKGLCLTGILWNALVQRSQGWDISKKKTPWRHWLILSEEYLCGKFTGVTDHSFLLEAVENESHLRHSVDKGCHDNYGQRHGNAFPLDVFDLHGWCICGLATE